MPTAYNSRVTDAHWDVENYVLCWWVVLTRNKTTLISLNVRCNWPCLCCFIWPSASARWGGEFVSKRRWQARAPAAVGLWARAGTRHILPCSFCSLPFTCWFVLPFFSPLERLAELLALQLWETRLKEFSQEHNIICKELKSLLRHYKEARTAGIQTEKGICGTSQALLLCGNCGLHHR